MYYIESLVDSSQEKSTPPICRFVNNIFKYNKCINKISNFSASTVMISKPENYNKKTKKSLYN